MALETLERLYKFKCKVKARWQNGKSRRDYVIKQAWVLAPTLPLTSWVTLGKVLNLSEHQFPHLQSGDIDTGCTGFERALNGIPNVTKVEECQTCCWFSLRDSLNTPRFGDMQNGVWRLPYTLATPSSRDMNTERAPSLVVMAASTAQPTLSREAHRPESKGDIWEVKVEG